jgi:UDP-N-acetylglucosamine acyltransferase
MTRIHATAVVDSKAEIASDVEIGPYSVIGPNIKIGAACKIGSHTVIEGYTTIGKENNFAHFAAIGGAPQDMKYRGEPTQLIIGELLLDHGYLILLQ